MVTKRQLVGSLLAVLHLSIPRGCSSAEVSRLTRWEP
jgi:hypothetical protein